MYNQIDDIVDCGWTPWIIGACSKSCGGGIRTRIRTVKVAAQHGGGECEGAKSIEEWCNVQDCPGYIYHQL